ncbi:MAG: FtsW/RodA/SpoVE family cell cycle protein [Oscillospiraceae bacterium]|nr:FtsW/RodA/SpoVE family cell cycle protein [Oscillospiraceae bacterium]
MAELYEFPDQKPDRPEVLPEPEQRPARRRGGRLGRVDVPFLVLTLLLLAVGLVMLLSSSYAIAYFETVTDTGEAAPMRYFTTQAIYAAIGIAAMIVVSFIPMGFLRRLSFLSLLAAFGLLLGVLLTGLRGNGAVRWIQIGPITAQPSELVKAAVILAFADWACRFGPEKMRSFTWGVVPFAAVLIIFSFLLLEQPHLSATIIILGIGAIMMFAGGTRWYWFAAAAVVVLMVVFYLRGHADWVIEKAKDSYMFARIAAWLDPDSQRLGDGWQIIQSLYAIGSGGLLGLGLGNSRQKYLYLPEAQNDYIFSIICEELGFVGAVLILLLFAVLILRGFWLALQCKNQFSRMMIIGFTGLIAIQVFLNVGVVTNFLPSTGISLPFFSSGGTALIVQLAEVGLILSASREIANK